MADSEEIAERFWSLPQKPDEESRRERLFFDDQIQKAHLDRVIDSRLDGVANALDVGAGTGRFSLRLAARGIEVTHLDVSPGMIAHAREEAQRSGLMDRMVFRRARIADLTDYPDRRFDLVICTDAPVSYAYPDHQAAVASLVRVAGKAIVLGVSSRLGYVSLALNPLQKEPYFADPDSLDPLVRFYRDWGRKRLESELPALDEAVAAMETGLLADPEQTERDFRAGRTPWPHNYLFLPEELEDLLHGLRVTDIRLAGPGALSRSLPSPVLRRLLSDPYRERFLDLCFRYDSQRSVCGMGKDGLVASGLVAP